MEKSEGGCKSISLDYGVTVSIVVRNVFCAPLESVMYRISVPHEYNSLHIRS